MKKILFISNYPRKINNYVIPSLEAARNLGYEFHYAGNMKFFKDDAVKNNVILHHLDLVRLPFHPQNIKAYNQLNELLRKEQFDVIHCNTPIGGVLGRFCGKKANVKKIIYTAHGFHFYEGAPLVYRTLFKWAEMCMAHHTDAIITLNCEDFQSAKKFKLRNGGKAYYVPGVGVETSVFKNAIPKKKEILEEIGADINSVLVISIGELNKNKNNLVIIKALNKLKKYNIHYILCGNGKKEDELLSMAKKNNLERNVHFLGYRTDVSQLLKSCDVFVMPSYREGLSRSLMEAMASGLPCIVSKIRGNVDLIEDGKGGYLCKPDDIDGFVKAISKISKDREIMKKMGEINLKVIKKYDFKNIKVIIKEIYNEVLSSVK